MFRQDRRRWSWVDHRRCDFVDGESLGPVVHPARVPGVVLCDIQAVRVRRAESMKSPRRRCDPFPNSEYETTDGRIVRERDLVMKKKRSCANCGHKDEKHEILSCNERRCPCRTYRERPSRARRLRNLVEYAKWAEKQKICKETRL